MAYLDEAGLAYYDGKIKDWMVSDAEVTAAGSTAGRTLPERFADVVNVKDFGAKGDGVTDDTAAFQAAAAVANGRHVFVPQGSVKLSESVSGKFFSDGEVTFTGYPIAVDVVTKDLSLKDNPIFAHLYSFTDIDESYGFLCQGIARSGDYLFIPTNQSGHNLTRLYKIDTTNKTRTYVNLASGKHFGSITIYNNKLYIVDNSSPSNIYVYNFDLTLNTIISLDFYLACIAYDEKRDCFWFLTSNGSSISMSQYSTSLESTEYSFTLPDNAYYAVVQDFCVYDGMFYFTRSHTWLESAIIFVTDVEGNIKKTYFLDDSFGEIEGLYLTSGHGLDVACNGTKKNISIYNADVFNDVLLTKPESPFRNIGGLRAVGNYKPLFYIYADASYSGNDSDGSSAKPFKSLVEAFDYVVVRNAKAQTGVVLSITGDFSSEEAITVYGFNGSLFVLGESTSTTKVNSLNFESCDYIQLSNIDFKCSPPASTGMGVAVTNCAVVDLRALSFSPSTKLATACFNAMRSVVYFVASCTFTNAVNGVRLYQSIASIGVDNTYTSCDISVMAYYSLIYGTADRMSTVTSSGSSVKLTAS